MFSFKWLTIHAYIIAISQSSLEIRKSGWLDRLVEYHKQNFIQDLQKIPNVQLKAKIESAPPGYVDSKEWDYESVIRLLTLIRQSEGLGPVRRAIRRALSQSTRRMSIKESLKLFPSLKKQIPNDIYYDIEESEEYYDVSIKTPLFENRTEDDAIIIVSNPVEARLPSAMISVNLLKEIMETRSQAARYMPKTRMTFKWKPRNKTTSTTQKIPDTTVETGTGVTGGEKAEAATGTTVAAA
ncbi:uncharacterized protein LOC123704353 [Colias croceus]|uniref:uncharacterized protein LOC123704353 n=1 Tax=Colias crocea TaxID=72248 RepID=UPI001E280F10|nr:uncharacterized protein LOC123704353 [Colias croceus]